MSIILLTDRLIIREFQLKDAAGFYAMNATEEVTRYTGDGPFSSMAEAEAFVAAYDHYRRYGFGRWTLESRSTGEYVGFCGLKYHPNTEEVDLGYRLPREHWGRGLATEAALACLQYGFSELELNRIIGRVAKANEASIRVLEKIGMTYVQDFDFAKGMPGSIYEAWAP